MNRDTKKVPCRDWVPKIRTRCPTVHPAGPSVLSKGRTTFNDASNYTLIKSANRPISPAENFRFISASCLIVMSMRIYSFQHAFIQLKKKMNVSIYIVYYNQNKIDLTELENSLEKSLLTQKG